MSFSRSIFRYRFTPQCVPAICRSLAATSIRAATILQFYRGFSDREMETACMFDIEIKYALGLRLDERSYDHSSLWRWGWFGIKV